jgi:signal transduction histidine kinase
VAAHKLRTPLTEIKWAAEALMDKSLKENDRHKFIKGIYRADEHLIELTNELLDVAKTDAMAYDYKLGPVNLEKTMKEVIKKFDTRIKEKNIKVSMHFERDLPKVMADKIRIGLVIERLLENAVFYTKNKIDISMDVYKKNLIFHIEDNGIGIIKEDQEYIFSKFYRGHNAYLTETEGSGVSLYLTKKIIEKHSGKIGVRSEGEGKGSIFWFNLPVIS